MDECASGFAGHLSRLFYRLRECIGSDGRLACVIGIPSGKVFLPEAKGFHLNSAYGLPSRGFSADIAPRGTCFRVFGSSKFSNTFKGNKIHGCKHRRIIAIQARELKVLYLLPIIKHP
jgi:hypothetical protein